MMVIGVSAAFLMLAAALTATVGIVLWRHGELLLRNRNETAGNSRLRSANRLTLTGFCLIMTGVVAVLLRIGGNPSSVIDGLAFMATRMGVLLVILGITHFYCLSVLSKIAGAPAAHHRNPPSRARPRCAREDPLDRVFEAAHLEGPIEG